METVPSLNYIFPVSKHKVFPNFPKWLGGKESTDQCRRHGLDPWSGKIAHAGELSPCATTTEPTLQSLGATAAEPKCPRARAPQQEETLQGEAHPPHETEAPTSHNQKKPCSNGDPEQPKLKK